MMRYFISFAIILLPYMGIAQVAAPQGGNIGPAILSGSVQQEKGTYKINVTRKYPHSPHLKEVTSAVAQMNTTCDTLQLWPDEALKIVQLGPNYYKVTRSGVEYRLEFLYRKPVQY